MRATVVILSLLCVIAGGRALAATPESPGTSSPGDGVVLAPLAPSFVPLPATDGPGWLFASRLHDTTRGSTRPLAGAPGPFAFAAETAQAATPRPVAIEIVVRYHEHVYAFTLACPHENTALRWRQQDGRFQCPRHESKYQPDGTFTSGRATRNMDRFAIRRSGDTVVVDLSRFYRSDRQPQEWAAAAVAI